MKFEGLVEGLHSTRTRRRMRRNEIVSSAMSHVHKGFGVVRPSLHGPADLPEFLQKTFNAKPESSSSVENSPPRACRTPALCFGFMSPPCRLLCPQSPTNHQIEDRYFQR